MSPPASNMLEWTWPLVTPWLLPPPWAPCESRGLRDLWNSRWGGRALNPQFVMVRPITSWPRSVLSAEGVCALLLSAQGSALWGPLPWLSGQLVTLREHQHRVGLGPAWGMQGTCSLPQLVRSEELHLAPVLPDVCSSPFPLFPSPKGAWAPRKKF